MQVAAGLQPTPDTEERSRPAASAVRSEKQVQPQSVISAQLANPFMVPDFSSAPARVQERRLAGWELIGPLLNSFEHATPGAPSCLELPPAKPVMLPDDLQLMDHQSRLLAAVAEGHRTFLLADEPGLEDRPSAAAAQAADAYPLLAVVPNVVKSNWAREAHLWTPSKKVSVVHGNGSDVDGFADIIAVNYEILDRHVGWMGEHGFRGMILDEAHFIKNKGSSAPRTYWRSPTASGSGFPPPDDGAHRHAVDQRCRGLPQRSWQFLGWIDEKKPRTPT